MKYVLLLLFMLSAAPVFAVTVDPVKNMPDGCEQSLLSKCDGWMFTYHYREPRSAIANHIVTVKETDVQFQYFVWNHPHLTDVWAATVEEARAMADKKAAETGVK